jgi:hypothetical protein
MIDIQRIENEDKLLLNDKGRKSPTYIRPPNVKRQISIERKGRRN